MSQQKQRDGTSDTQYLALDSPTIGRMQSYSPNSSQGSQSPLSDAGYRSQRKAAPSPLQSSTSAISPSPTPTRATFARPLADSSPATVETVRYTPGMSDHPRSPKERLDDLLASERSFYNTDELQEKMGSGIDSRVEQSFNPLTSSFRSFSDPVSVSKPAVGSSATTAKPIPSTNSSSHGRDMARGPPRTSSIDSAISSISIGTHSPKSSQDGQSQGATDSEITNLIQAAGSPEAVIQYLLKQKQSQSAQNTQLWRLVDKQRAMILGLNKDLERALKDKERYRKKLKESLSQFSDNTSQTSQNKNGDSSSADSRATGSSRPGHIEALISAGLREQHVDNDEPQSPIDVTLAPYPVTPPLPLDQQSTDTKPLTSLVEVEQKMPSPSEHSFPLRDANSANLVVGSSTKQQDGKGSMSEMPYHSSSPPPGFSPPEPPRTTAPRSPQIRETSSVAIPELTSSVDAGHKPFAQLPQPPRKPPPAPLNLGKPIDTSSHLYQADSADEVDSDYDDVLEVEEVPSFDRGRRRTREQDDREREAAALRDAEIRSLSKKSKTKAKEKTPEPPIQQVLGATRQAVQISPPDSHSRHLSPPDSVAGSLAGVLSASGLSDRMSDVSSRRVLLPPLLSPGLPSSPRPVDRGMGSPLPRNPRDGTSLASPPMSPRGMGAFPSSVPLSPRAPRHPIPLPPNTPMSLASPSAPKPGVLELSSPKPLQIKKFAGNSPEDADLSRNIIDREFVTDEYPDLLLPPNALPSVVVQVAPGPKAFGTSSMFPNNHDDDPVCAFAVFSRMDGRELWRVEKDWTSLSQLDQQLRQFPLSAAKIPDRALFSGSAPARSDARRAALNTYFDEILNTEMDTTSALGICKFLSTNTKAPHPGDAHSRSTFGDTADESQVKLGPNGKSTKNGYLAKRGKNFGGWKTRFFVLDGPVLKYFEAPGGAHLGVIKLQNAQIAKQHQHQADNGSPGGETDDITNQYRHAFLVLEPKRKDSSSLVRHVLCAETEKERDNWVEAMLQYVSHQDSDDDEDTMEFRHARTDSEASGNAITASKKKLYGQGRVLNIPESEESLRGFSYENTAPGDLPYNVGQKNSETPSPPVNGYEKDPISQIPHSTSSKSISAPTNATVIQDTGAWGNKPMSLAPAEDKTKQKKRSFFGFGSKARASSDSPDSPRDPSTYSVQQSYDHGPVRAVFGAPLAEAVRYNHPADLNLEIPAVVYRCVEYLEERNAASEEGIFRLSGSNVVIKSLRERFNVEGDVNLITDDQYYDIHAVASLLKLYLRELPTTILTRELHLDFLAVTEINNTQAKVQALNMLVHKLPSVNAALLRYLASFLISIVNHSDVNRMTVRNVGIVFSPTLNIPAPVFALFLQQYDGIFDAEPDLQESTPIEVTVTAPLTPEDIRSPRRQQFQELPTPSYNQQSFSRAPPPSFQLNKQLNQSVYDTGFAPLQPTYENQVYQSQTLGGPEYGSQNQTLAGPSYDQFSNAYRQYGNDSNMSTTVPKSKRRESAMFGMNSDLSKKPSYSNIGDENRLVHEESFFE